MSLRFLIAMLLLLAVTTPAQIRVLADPPVNPQVAEQAAKSPFFPDGVVHDFGAVPRGVVVHHYFRLVNSSNEPLKVNDVRGTMGATMARSTKQFFAPNEEGAIVVRLDSSRFVGPKTTTTFVTVQNGKSWFEVRLTVTATSCNEVTTNDRFTFEKTAKGKRSTKTISVHVDPKVRLVGAEAESRLIEVSFKERQRDDEKIEYELTATATPEIPVGDWYTDVVLTTDQKSIPPLRIPLTITIVENHGQAKNPHPAR